VGILGPLFSSVLDPGLWFPEAPDMAEKTERVDFKWNMMVHA